MSKWLALMLILASTNSFAKDQVRVGIIDSGLDLTDKRFSSRLCKSGHHDYTGEGIEDLDGHGTHIAGLIMVFADVATNYCFVILKYYSKSVSSQVNADNFAYAVSEATRQRLKIVNISGGGPNVIIQEYLAYKMNPNTLFFVSAGNEGKDLEKHPYYPASYNLKNIIVVGSLTREQVKASSSNYGKIVKKWEVGDERRSYAIKSGLKVMSGTSQATAIATGKYIYENHR